jgi:hypothetical protein
MAFDASNSTTAEPPVLDGVNTDLADEIPAMYRFLDLVSEQGSSGLGTRPFAVLKITTHA